MLKTLRGRTKMEEALIVIATLILCTMIFVGCTPIKNGDMTPNQAYLASYKVIEEMAKAIDTAADSNLISEDTELELLGKLEDAVVLLDQADDLVDTKPETAADQLELAQKILVAVQKLMVEKGIK